MIRKLLENFAIRIIKLISKNSSRDVLLKICDCFIWLAYELYPKEKVFSSLSDFNPEIEKKWNPEIPEGWNTFLQDSGEKKGIIKRSIFSEPKNISSDSDEMLDLRKSLSSLKFSSSDDIDLEKETAFVEKEIRDIAEMSGWAEEEVKDTVSKVKEILVKRNLKEHLSKYSPPSHPKRSLYKP